MKLVTWNVNGIRSACRKGFLEWLAREQPDVVCVQEIKIQESQCDETLRNPPGYQTYWHPAEKKGYSGVATFCRQEPEAVRCGLGLSEYDAEGRVLITEYPGFVLLNVYVPNGQRDHGRVPFKLAFCDALLALCTDLTSKGRHVIVCGDFNTAHREIDLKNPKSNANTTGFLPVERAWIDTFIDHGYVDIFRELNPEPGHYTWWSYRPGVRERNIGWRIDYHFVSQGLRDRVKNAYLLPRVEGSDHCPAVLELEKGRS
jgi:exodeoxyribonuclease-3